MFPVLAQGALRVNLCPRHPVESNLVTDGHLIFRQTEQFCASLQSNVLLNFFFPFSGHAHSQFYARSRHRGEFKERIVTSSWPAVSSATWRAQRGEWWALICTCFFQLFDLVKVFLFIVVIEPIFLFIFLFSSLLEKKIWVIPCCLLWPSVFHSEQDWGPTIRGKNKGKCLLL